MKPVNEEERQRLQEIADLDLLSGDTDAILQEAVKEAADTFGLPIGLVSIVLDEAQHFAASHGLTGWMANAQGAPVEWSFCALAVKTRAPLYIENATQDPRVAKNPLVVDDGVRCYFGVPLTTSRGHVIGTLCVLGNEEITAGDKEKEALRALGRKVVKRIEERRATR